MHKKLNFTVLLLMAWGFGFPQNSNGANVGGTGINTPTSTDCYNTHSNPANICATSQRTIAFNYLQFVADNELSEQILNIIWPTKLAHFALNIYRYGIAAYQELETGFTLAKPIGQKLSLGLKFNYHQLKIVSYGFAGSFSFDFGLRYKLDTSWTVGLHINSLGRNFLLQPLTRTLIPISYSIGAAYQLSDKLLFTTTIQRITRTDFGFSIEYLPAPVFSIRAGTTLNPLKQYAGFGIVIKRLEIDFALENNAFIAQKPQLGITYAF